MMTYREQLSPGSWANLICNESLKSCSGRSEYNSQYPFQSLFWRVWCSVLTQEYLNSRRELL
jgi:hypothetical protein